MKDYRGIRIVRKTHKPTNPKANGSYSKPRNAIILYDKFFDLEPDIQASILEHEYSHYIWHKMPSSIQRIWQLISVGDPRILKKLDYKENAYVTEYAKTKITEDWAECIETEWLLSNSKKYKGKKFGTYADFKLKIAKKIYDYYCRQKHW